MKKITYFIILFILLIYIGACAGYKPIYSSSNLQFEIATYAIEGNKKLGNQIYSKLYNLSKSNKNNPAAQSINISIKVLKDKNATAKNSAGKILEYKITLNTQIIIKDFLTNDKILNKNFTSFSSYKVQDQHYETVKLENKTIESLLNKTYQDLLIDISKNILTE